MKNTENALQIGVAVLTLNGARHLPYCLPPLISSSLKPKILVIDSSSDDDTLACAQNLGANALSIPRAAFDHGATRELARQQLATDIIVMVTQDAYACDQNALSLLVEPLQQGKAAVAYGRQLPHPGAALCESFHRQFNYSHKSHIRSFADVSHYGKYTFFCSNSFAAYSNSALDVIGGFEPTLFGEDTIAVARLLRRGYNIAYVAEACVLHSHSYSLKQELQRHFDIGYSRRQHDDLLATEDADSVRGRLYACSLLQKLWHEAPCQLPYGCMLLGTKWLGYQLGWRGTSLPSCFKRLLSSQKKAWPVSKIF